MRIPKENNSNTVYCCVSEDEIKQENERAFVQSCLACMELDDIVEMLEDVGIEDEILTALADKMGYYLE